MSRAALWLWLLPVSAFNCPWNSGLTCTTKFIGGGDCRDGSFRAYDNCATSVSGGPNACAQKCGSNSGCRSVTFVSNSGWCRVEVSNGQTLPNCGGSYWSGGTAVGVPTQTDGTSGYACYTIVQVTQPPTRSPRKAPTRSPTRPPVPAPTRSPSIPPTRAPSLPPSAAPSRSPTVAPGIPPTASPSRPPSAAPSAPPSRAPTRSPSVPPSTAPTAAPSRQPSSSPSAPPSRRPSTTPSSAPSSAPSTAPSRAPSLPPSRAPSAPPTRAPTQAPSVKPSTSPTVMPSASPSNRPSRAPSASPSTSPSRRPSKSPSVPPSRSPSRTPSVPPSRSPTVTPSRSPSGTPSAAPTVAPSAAPSPAPSGQPSESPTAQPSASPTLQPTRQPSSPPTVPPSGRPSTPPSASPTASPSVRPSSRPTASPSAAPSLPPVASPPTASPSRQPSSLPTATPSLPPSAAPATSPPTAPPVLPPSAGPATQPTVAPSAAPAHASTVMDDIRAGVVGSAAGASVVSASAVTATQGGKLDLLLSLSACPVDENADAADADFGNPLGFRVAGSALPNESGTLVWSWVLVSTILAAHALLALGVARCRDEDFHTAEALVRFPSFSVWPVLFAYQHAAQSSLAIVVRSNKSGAAAAATASLLFIAPAAIWTVILCTKRLMPPDCEPVPSGNKDVYWRYLLFGDSVWRSPTDRTFVRRWALVFKDYRYRFRWWLITELVMLLLLAAIGVWHPSDTEMCALRSGLCALLFLLSFLVVCTLRLRLYISTLDVVHHAVTSGLQAAAAVFVTFALLRHENASLTVAAVMLTMAATTTTVKALFDLFVWLVERYRPVRRLMPDDSAVGAHSLVEITPQEALLLAPDRTVDKKMKDNCTPDNFDGLPDACGRGRKLSNTSVTTPHQEHLLPMRTVSGEPTSTMSSVNPPADSSASTKRHSSFDSESPSRKEARRRLIQEQRRVWPFDALPPPTLTVTPAAEMQGPQPPTRRRPSPPTGISSMPRNVSVTTPLSSVGRTRQSSQARAHGTSSGLESGALLEMPKPRRHRSTTPNARDAPPSSPTSPTTTKKRAGSRAAAHESADSARRRPVSPRVSAQNRADFKALFIDPRRTV
eukprot:TRINITY_DN4495_c0_g1_i4.p1 TRINITY_DN4495_c0_g1~~TRINITY_DN4495_c0_g1_i4.p1  ORF type:complete len:1108 (+),score=198.37 TRINITY_DN4495_c0_g1_i4:79-3402(+)